MDKLTLAWMYPDCLNLHGERGSIQALMRIGEKMGLQMELLRIPDFNDPIPFDRIDLMVLLPGELRLMPALVQALDRRREALTDYLQRGGWLVAMGTTGLIFGREVRREDGTVLQGLGLLDLTAREREYVLGDDLHVRLPDGMELAGCQIQMADVHAAAPLGHVLWGRGNDGSGAEGARFKNLVYTNCLGPLFVKNPWWGQAILRDIAEKRSLPVKDPEPDELAKAAFDAAVRYMNAK